jgi:hypothetical protein
LRQAILGPLAAWRDASLDHTGLLQPAQALGQKRARDAGQAALELVEVADLGQQLAHDQHRPAIGEDLRRARHRTVLAVQVHGLSVARIARCSSPFFVLAPLAARGADDRRN